MLNKERIAQVIEQQDTLAGKVFSVFIQSLIVISLITFSISTLPDLPSSTIDFLEFIEIVTVIIFTVEYILRIVIAKNKFAFIFSFYGIIDLLAILPFYIATAIDLRAIRIFRLLRLFRILKIVRYNKAINRFYTAFKIAKEELVLFSIVSLILLYLSAVGIYYFENVAQPDKFSSVFHCLWWAVSTLTTVGYGDIFPITIGGKIFTFIVLMIGLGIVAVPAGLLSSALLQARKEESLN